MMITIVDKLLHYLRKFTLSLKMVIPSPTTGIPTTLQLSFFFYYSSEKPLLCSSISFASFHLLPIRRVLQDNLHVHVEEDYLFLSFVFYVSFCTFLL